MALPLRPRAIPQCSACIRSFTLTALVHVATPVPSALRQQVRGKKKLANLSHTVPVRLLKNVKTFGRRGAIVPISQGQMRNDWFPRRVAEYVTVPELKTLRSNNTAMERDFNFGVAGLGKQGSITAELPTDGKGMSASEKQEASMFQKESGPKKLSPERSVELLEIFVPKTLDFYRQPIIEEAPPESLAPPEPEKKTPNFGRGAGAELLAARAQRPESTKPVKPAGPQAIYGSVSTADVLTAVKAVMAENDEAARVVLHGEDVKFVDLPKGFEAEETDRVKHVGEFAVEVSMKGAEKNIRRSVRVVAQEAA